MKITHVNFSDISGGAARAAYRLHWALRGQGVDSKMAVNYATAADWTVGSLETRLEKIYAKVAPHWATLYTRLLSTDNKTLHSPAIVPSVWPNRLNKSDADIVHLHWIAGEMLSIKDISKVTKPLVWTLHDMWGFCGAEHVTEEFRWKEGYYKNNRPGYEGGFDLNRWVWNRKRRHWKEPVQIITPSRWMANCVKESALMHDWPVSVVPNAIDTNLWQSVDKKLARKLLGLPQDVPLMLFGAMGGASDPNKGFDLLSSSLKHINKNIPELELVVFGQLAPKVSLEQEFPIHYAGLLHDDASLILLYSAADVLVIPSRKENLPNTGIEASACSTPVVGFNTGGISDIIKHRETGYLAKAFDTVDLANGIYWTLADSKRNTKLGNNARDRAVSRWSNHIVAQQYSAIYQQTLDV